MFYCLKPFWWSIQNKTSNWIWISSRKIEYYYPCFCTLHSYNNYPRTPPASVSDCWSNTSRMLASEYIACGVLYCALTWDACCEGGFAGLDKPLEDIDPLPVVSGLVKKQEIRNPQEVEMPYHGMKKKNLRKDSKTCFNQVLSIVGVISLQWFVS